ncbi:AI-2E family transporter [Dactylosporangium sp. NPDC005572]|uniref:AI-2E family transporter n=1 Tax=Dactylosporangium sp. NPDC005572 TaxID=3156889 RepID=UPI0033AADF4C
MNFAKVYRLSVAAGLGLLTVAAGAFALYSVRRVLVQVVIALFVAVSLDPAVRLLIRHGVRRSVAVAAILVVAVGLLVAFVWSLVPPLVGQAGELLQNIPQYLQELPERSRAYREVADRYGLTARLTEFAKTVPAKVGGGALGVITGIFSALFNVLLVAVLTIYFMADLPRLRRGLVRLVPRARRPRAAQAVNVVVDKVGGYMIGNLIISLFAGVTSFACLFALGVPYALPLAVFVAVTDLIPMIGATVGAVGCTIVALVTGDLWPTAVVVVVFFLAYQQLENYLIAPRVLRNTVDLSSVAVLLAALVGGAILGVVGALMAIPIVAAVKVLMTPMVEALNQPPEPAEPAAPPPVPIPAPRDEDGPKPAPGDKDSPD